MKNWVTISLVLFLSILAVLIYSVYRSVQLMQFDIKIEGVTTNIDSFSDFQDFMGGRGATTINFLVSMNNPNWFRIPIRDLETRVYYKGRLIGNSSPNAAKNIDLPPESENSWIEPVDIHTKGKIVKAFLNEIIKGNDPVISYETELKVFGVRYQYADQLKIVETIL